MNGDKTTAGSNYAFNSEVKLLSDIKPYQEFFEGQYRVDYVVAIDSMQGLRRWQQAQLEDRLSSETASTKTSGDGWSGTKTIEEWFDVIQNGDEKVMEKIKKSKEEAQKELGNYVVKGYLFDVEGEFFDIGEVLAGKPESWLNPIKEELEKKITIHISTSANAGVNADDIARGAGELLAIVAELERDDYKVRVVNMLFTTDVADGMKSNRLIQVTVKDYNEPLNYSKMSAIVSPALQRRGSFMIDEQLFKRSLSGGYGRSRSDMKNITTVYNKDQMKKLRDKLFEYRKDKK